MPKKKLLLASVVLVASVAMVAGYNRPYRWWPINEMSEQTIIKPFNENGLRAPVEGTVAVEQWAWVPPRAEIDSAGITNPIPSSEASVAEGEELYNTYCLSCHGEGMQNDEEHMSPVQRRGMPGANLDLVKMRSDASIFATMTHGSAIMKRVSYHLSPEERWHVVNYIRHLAKQQD